MDNQQDHQEIEIDNKIGFTIGIHKYNNLKSKPSEERTEEENYQIELYEAKHKAISPEQVENIVNYFEKIYSREELKPKEINSRKLWELFKQYFPIVNGRPFIKIENVTIKNLEPIIYYFAKDKRFFECENLSKLSEPSFDKGLLIIGNFGNGKTSTMRTFEAIFKGLEGYQFKGFKANEVVTMFEKCSSDSDREEFEKLMHRGTRYFDDVKTERIASNYGKVNIFKEIFEERETRFYPTKLKTEIKRKIKTHVTCNYKEDYPDDIQAALDEFEEKYGGRVYDRIFLMFNIIIFNGKSFRK